MTTCPPSPPPQEHRDRSSDDTNDVTPVKQQHDSSPTTKAGRSYTMNSTSSMGHQSDCTDISAYRDNHEAPDNVPTPTCKEGRNVIVLVLMTCFVFLASANEISAKIRADALSQQYNAIIAQILGQIIYFSVYGILVLSRKKKIPKEDLDYMWSFWTSKVIEYQERNGQMDTDSFRERVALYWHRLGPWKFALIQALGDVVGSTLGAIAQPELSVVTFSVIRKSTVAIIFFWSMIILRKRYVMWEVIGVLIVTVATCSTVFFQNSRGKESKAVYALLLLSGRFFHGLCYCFMEKIFRNFEKFYGRTKEAGGLDPFVVASLCATLSLVWVLPVALVTEQVRISSQPWGENLSLATHIGNAFRCLANQPTDEMFDIAQMWAESQGKVFRPERVCTSGWEAFVVYTIVNLLFNIVLYLIIKMDSALLVFVSMQMSLPISALLMNINWPIIGHERVSLLMWCILVVLLLGVSMYRWGNLVNEKVRKAHQLSIETGTRSQRSKVWLCLWPLLKRKPRMCRKKRVGGRRDKAYSCDSFCSVDA